MKKVGSSLGKMTITEACTHTNHKGNALISSLHGTEENDSCHESFPTF